MQMILWPAVITLAVTLLRLVGELQGWNKVFFNPVAGGGGAIIGISWLPFLFGPYFAWKLARSGRAPQRPWKVAGMALLGIAVAIGAFAGVMSIGPQRGTILVALLLTLAAAFVPWKAWPELAKVLLAYAFAARVPVAIVMLAAVFGNWGTHYDVLPDNAPASLLALGPLGRWFYIGFLPQLTIWIAQTVLIGTLFGATVVALGKPKPATR
jgi:hypothetical protein